MNKKLKAPQVDRYLWWLGQMDYQKYDHASKYDARSYELLDELFELLKNIKLLKGLVPGNSGFVQNVAPLKTTATMKRCSIVVRSKTTKII